MILHKDFLAFLGSIIFSVIVIYIINSLNLPKFVTFSIAIYASYILMFLAMLHHYISQVKQNK
jgi:hypothetical protein